MTTRIVVKLDKFENRALSALAEREYRNPRAQAAFIIRRELERCGLLEALEIDVDELNGVGNENVE